MKKTANNTAKKLVRLMLVMAVLSVAFGAMAGLVFAAEDNKTVATAQTTQGETQTAPNNNLGLGLIAAALSTGIAGVGSGIAVAAGAPAAIGALTEDATTFGKSLIFVALGEGIALYGMLVSILILNKI
ncbi:MAG: ATP synthase subunit C [Oscillospiraceae bacterium]